MVTYRRCSSYKNCGSNLNKNKRNFLKKSFIIKRPQKMSSNTLESRSKRTKPSKANHRRKRHRTDRCSMSRKVHQPTRSITRLRSEQTGMEHRRNKYPDE